MYEKRYVDTQADNIIDDLFDGVGELPEITYDNSGITTTAIDYEARLGTYYSQILREIGQEIDYDGYVSTSDTLRFFPVGSISSGVTLADTSNILNLRYTENDDINLRNNIRIEASQIFDGYSEKNASAYDASGTNTTITDESAIIAVGDWSIEGECGVDNLCQIRLDLSSCFDGDSDHVWDEIDVSNESRKIAWFCRTDNAPADQFIDLEDSNGDHIHWYSEFICDIPVADTWYYNELTIGSDQRIVTLGVPNNKDQWEYDGVGGDAFNWVIKKIEWEQLDAVNGDFYYLDGLGLPMNLLCQKTNAASIATYSTRKLYLRRPDIYT